MTSLIPVEVITSKIYLIRSIKVMLDRDLAELYGVETKRLKEHVPHRRGDEPHSQKSEVRGQKSEDVPHRRM